MLAAVDVAAVVFTVRRNFARRHVLAEARRHLLETLRGHAFTRGLDDYIANRALADHARQTTVPQPGRRAPGADQIFYTADFTEPDRWWIAGAGGKPPRESSRYERARIASLAVRNAIDDALTPPGRMMSRPRRRRPPRTPSTAPAGKRPPPRRNGRLPSTPTSRPRCPTRIWEAGRPTRRRGCAHRSTWPGSPPSPAWPTPAAAPSRTDRPRPQTRAVRLTGTARSTSSSSPARTKARASSRDSPPGGTGGEATGPDAGTRPVAHCRDHQGPARVRGTAPFEHGGLMVAPTLPHLSAAQRERLEQLADAVTTLFFTPEPERKGRGGDHRVRGAAARDGGERAPGRCAVAAAGRASLMAGKRKTNEAGSTNDLRADVLSVLGVLKVATADQIQRLASPHLSYRHTLKKTPATRKEARTASHRGAANDLRGHGLLVDGGRTRGNEEVRILTAAGLAAAGLDLDREPEEMGGMPKSAGRSGVSHPMTVNETAIALIRPKPDLDLVAGEPAEAAAAAQAAVDAPGGIGTLTSYATEVALPVKGTWKNPATAWSRCGTRSATIAGTPTSPAAARPPERRSDAARKSEPQSGRRGGRRARTAGPSSPTTGGEQSGTPATLSRTSTCARNARAGRSQQSSRRKPTNVSARSRSSFASRRRPPGRRPKRRRRRTAACSAAAGSWPAAGSVPRGTLRGVPLPGAASPGAEPSLSVAAGRLVR